MTEKAFSRRSFMTGLAAAGAFGWLHDSPSLSARILRGSLHDFRRDVVQIAPANLSSWSDKSVDVCWVGHATVLLNFFGVHILTDPVLFDSVGAQLGIATIGRKRIVGPALDPDNLPRIDLVLLSHAHMDHMDLPSLGRIPNGAAVVSAPRTLDIFADRGFKNRSELRWGQKSLVHTPSGDVEVEAVEVKHWGARWKSDSYRGYVGYLLKRGGKTILFGGDTAYTDAFASLRNRNIDLAVMPIGSYGSKSGNHCTPEESVEMLNACRANYIVPVHHSTFPLGIEPIEEPLTRLKSAVAADRIAIHHIGETWRLPA
jgi:L-ascorbate metabolism protein UlaG (beta-lactamase superfamily)